MDFEPAPGSCPECSGEHLIRDYQRAEVLCDDCGLVIEENMLDPGPEWRDFDDRDRERTGPPANVLEHDMGLATDISWSNKDASGRFIAHNTRPQMYRLRKWQRRIRFNKPAERSLAQALGDIKSMCSRMGLPMQIRESAAMLYRKAAAKHLIRGRSIKAVVAACVYAACRQSGIPRSLKEISAEASVGKKPVGRTYRALARTLNLTLQVQSPADYIPRFCSELELGQKALNKSLKVAEKAWEKKKETGANPIGIAATSIYIACRKLGIVCTQRDVSYVTDVTEVTMRNHLKDLAPELRVVKS